MTLITAVQQGLGWFRGQTAREELARRYGAEQTLTQELFSMEQLGLHAQALAIRHTVDPRPGPDMLLARLCQNEAVLAQAYDLETAALKQGRELTTIAEWLLDNFHLVEEQIRMARRHLPKSYSRELPRVLNSQQSGSPRVYDIAQELISHVDGCVDAENLPAFVAAYQKVTVLKLGELWAIPIMLRLALIENLRRVAARIAARRIDLDSADRWAERLIEKAEKDPKNLILVLAEMSAAQPALSSAFVTQFTRRLQKQDVDLAFPLSWAEQQLAQQGTTVEQLVNAESHEQATEQVSIRNSIGSLRFLGATDWRDFVEAMSAVEKLLRSDPCGIYPLMDFATRDCCRHAVERIAKKKKCTESEVAALALHKARESLGLRGQRDPQAHLSYYLVGQGVDLLEQSADLKTKTFKLIAKTVRRHSLGLYLSAIFLTAAVATTALLMWALSYSADHAMAQVWAMAAAGVLLFVCLSQTCIDLVNSVVTLLAKPKPLPRMDFSNGIPPDCATLVAIPTMLVNEESTRRLLEALEVRYLANRDKYLYFSLLTDFTDAPLEVMPGDDQLVLNAKLGIDALNAQYKNGTQTPFFLFHRARRWNPQEGVWMGYERKRGKLTDLNALLRGGPQDVFSTIAGDTAILQDVKYVITLDTDTLLPHDAARHLVATIAHPLNRAQYDEKMGRVVSGYGILQPRVCVSLPTARKSWYVRLFSGDPGIDPYTRTVSDVYQDLFGEGSFIGKGIYEVDIFRQALDGRFPENQILSHDLIEGCYARAGLASDVQVYEDHPSRYGADVSRRRRWIRGDWQIAAWALPWIPGAQGGWTRNPLSALSRWKIFDNLRRSLTPLCMTLLFLLVWVALRPAWAWTCAGVAVILLPSLWSWSAELWRKPAELPWGMHLRSCARLIGRRLAQALFGLAMLPYEACFSMDAIIRSCTRMLITRKRLLEWTTSDESARKSSSCFSVAARLMWTSPVMASAAAIALGFWRPEALPAAGALLVMWFSSPLLAWWVSRLLPRRQSKLTPRQIAFLELQARKTWRFFETFSGPDEHWLPADNYQESPVPVTAHRTSPTNMGISLLAGLAAYDFGYVSVGQLIERTTRSLNTMNGLERFRGHFYNWYDTHSLRPLPPLYVSSVDSGNLAGHLMVLRQGLLASPSASIIQGRLFPGLRDTLGALAQATGTTPQQEMPEFILRLEETLESPPTTLSEINACLSDLAAEALRMADNPDANANAEVKWWRNAFELQCREQQADLALIAPWTQLPPPPDNLWNGGSAEFVALREALLSLENGPTLRQVAGIELSLFPVVDSVLRAIRGANSVPNSPQEEWLLLMRRSITEAANSASKRIHELEQLASLCAELSDQEYGFLYDASRCLLAVGYNVQDRRRDVSFYDLLAAEARLSSFIGVALGQIPEEHWFSLGRQLTTCGGSMALLSWSGSMFEYLMPLLVMPTYENTLLDQTCKAVVARQIEYGRQHGRPWGISESGYNFRDARLDYQYKAFGVPGLGLKRGLSNDFVVAPYASMLALMVAPEKACANLQRLASDESAEGAFGMYEAVDYTPSRVPRGHSSAVVCSFMAHHQGMSFLSMASLLLGRPMQRRFRSDPLFLAAELLLHERIPRATPFYPHAVEACASRPVTVGEEKLMRVFTTPHTAHPEVQLLSNGRYSVMVTNSGGGYSRWKDLAVTRWREDTTRDNWGQFCYVRDIESGEFWSTTYQPVLKAGSRYEAIFSQARAEFRRMDNELESYSEIIVSPEDDIELRRTTFTNRSHSRRIVEVTTYAEVVLAHSSSDDTHPSFSNLFVKTEIIRSRQAIFCTRRRRDPEEHHPWMLHLLAVHGVGVGEASYETDRMKFVGRTRTPADPLAMHDLKRLSGSEGPVLDPIVSVRRRIVIEPDESAIVDVVTGVAETRDAALALVEKYHDRRLADRVIELSWTHEQVAFRQLQATQGDLNLYQQLASPILYTHSARRASPSALINNRRPQSGLWGYGVSGDLPIVLLRIEDRAHIDLVRETLQAHACWRMLGLAVDLLICNEDRSGYRQVIQDEITTLLTSGGHHMDRPGGIFLRRAELMPEEDRILLQTAARLILVGSVGSLAEHAERRARAEYRMPRLQRQAVRAGAEVRSETPHRELIFFNGFGGFTMDGHEYVITTSADLPTPAPWVNVLANPGFGAVVSESGGGYTWCENAHEFRLTPWSNDPVSDISGEALYVRDEETGSFWSPTPLPARGVTPYITRHGFGYTVFEHSENGITTELWIYVAVDAPVKFFALKVRNDSGRQRRLSVTAFFEWVLGELRHNSLLYVTTEADPKTGALFAQNPYQTTLPGRVVFLDVNEPVRALAGDRAEFLGRNGTLSSPAAMKQVRLSGRTGAGLDPCGAMQVQFDVADREEREITFLLGAGSDAIHARDLIQRFRGSGPARNALEAVWDLWNRTLGAVYVETPDRSIDLMANGWLMYQTISCRMWGRSGFYQSGGAFGFRDQLQDAMALVHVDAARLREHLLLCAAHQFVEGDALHWWHPPTGRGVRTRCSDDYLWFPLAMCRYVLSTGDTGVLDEPVCYLEAPALRPDEESRYDLYGPSSQTGTLYEHCTRAIERGLQFGLHGLPLIGSCDWNDGMNLVGKEGKGESVWLGFFLCYVLKQFQEVARNRGDVVFAKRCETEATRLGTNIDQHAWDGEWYLRAFFDDGTPLGSAVNSECQIDSISQSWAVLSGVGDAERSRQAMESLDKRLVHRDASLILLLDPPFDKSDQEPGYIKGYVPGVRENGGQYTHAAIWAVMAFAAQGDCQRAWELMSRINPINHGATADQISTYRVEPYAVAGDIYGAPPHLGRGGWTWYTGSAAWMYRLIVESLLGLSIEVGVLRVTPCLPPDWSSYLVNYRYRETFTRIQVTRIGIGNKVARVTADGISQPSMTIPLCDDHLEHSALVEIGSRASD